MHPDRLRPPELVVNKQFEAPLYAVDPPFTREAEDDTSCSYVPRGRFLDCMLVEEGPTVDNPVAVGTIKRTPTEPPDVSPDASPEPAERCPAIEIATPFTLWQTLPDNPESTLVVWPFQNLYKNDEPDSSRTDFNHPHGQQSVVATQHRPAIIYDDGADICSPILAFDEAGSAVHFHSSAGSTPGGFRALDEEYFSHLTGWIGQGKVTFVMGGLNMSPNDGSEWDDPHQIVESTIKQVEQQARAVFPDADFVPLVSRQSSNQQLTHSGIPANTKMRGLIFVPRYIARDDTNHVYSIADGDKDAVRNVFRWVANIGRP